MFMDGIIQTPLKSLQKFWMASLTTEQNKEQASSSGFGQGLRSKMYKSEDDLKKPSTTEQDIRVEQYKPAASSRSAQVHVLEF